MSLDHLQIQFLPSLSNGSNPEWWVYDLPSLHSLPSPISPTPSAMKVPFHLGPSFFATTLFNDLKTTHFIDNKKIRNIEHYEHWPLTIAETGPFIDSPAQLSQQPPYMPHLPLLCSPGTCHYWQHIIQHTSQYYSWCNVVTARSAITFPSPPGSGLPCLSSSTHRSMSCPSFGWTNLIISAHNLYVHTVLPSPLKSWILSIG